MRPFLASRSEILQSVGTWRNSAGVVCMLAVLADIVAWFTLVPVPVSVAAFGWANLLVALMLGVGGIAATGALPTRSIAHVLHDVEHPPVSRH